MLSIATLFDDEQRLLNRLWIILLGLEALLVLFGTVSAIWRGIVAMRRRRPGFGKGGRRHVMIALPPTVLEAEEYDEYDDGDISHNETDDVVYVQGKPKSYGTSVVTRTGWSPPASILNSPSSTV